MKQIGKLFFRKGRSAYGTLMFPAHVQVPPGFRTMGMFGRAYVVVRWVRLTEYEVVEEPLTLWTQARLLWYRVRYRVRGRRW